MASRNQERRVNLYLAQVASVFTLPLIEQGIALSPGDWRLLKTHFAEIDLAMESLEGRGKTIKSAAIVEESVE